MDRIIDGISRFKSDIFPKQRALYQRLARLGQDPTTLLISCSDSRVVPEIITQSDPGDMFVCRNAGNVVPPFNAAVAGGVTSAIEYAVVALKVEDIVVCGHSDCGAMKALLRPELLDEMPSVKSWLGHCKCAETVFRHARLEGLDDRDAIRILAMQNVVSQLDHLRTHPCVAARLATGSLRLHGWFFDPKPDRFSPWTGRRTSFRPSMTRPVFRSPSRDAAAFPAWGRPSRRNRRKTIRSPTHFVMLRTYRGKRRPLSSTHRGNAKRETPPARQTTGPNATGGIVRHLGDYT